MWADEYGPVPVLQEKMSTKIRNSHPCPIEGVAGVLEGFLVNLGRARAPLLTRQWLRKAWRSSAGRTCEAQWLLRGFR